MIFQLITHFLSYRQAAIIVKSGYLVGFSADFKVIVIFKVSTKITYFSLVT